MEEQSSLFQCATLEFGSSSDSQERIYGPRGEICQGPAERDKIFQGHGGFFVFFFFFHGVAEMKDANPSLMDQDPTSTPSTRRRHSGLQKEGSNQVLFPRCSFL